MHSGHIQALVCQFSYSYWGGPALSPASHCQHKRWCVERSGPVWPATSLVSNCQVARSQTLPLNDLFCAKSIPSNKNIYLQNLPLPLLFEMQAFAPAQVLDVLRKTLRREPAQRTDALTSLEKWTPLGRQREFLPRTWISLELRVRWSRSAQV